MIRVCAYLEALLLMMKGKGRLEIKKEINSSLENLDAPYYPDEYVSSQIRRVKKL